LSFPRATVLLSIPNYSCSYAVHNWAKPAHGLLLHFKAMTFGHGGFHRLACASEPPTPKRFNQSRLWASNEVTT
jgi:hypothetical protein